MTMRSRQQSWRTCQFAKLKASSCAGTPWARPPCPEALYKRILIVNGRIVGHWQRTPFSHNGFDRLCKHAHKGICRLCVIAVEVRRYARCRHACFFSELCLVKRRIGRGRRDGGIAPYHRGKDTDVCKEATPGLLQREQGDCSINHTRKSSTPRNVRGLTGTGPAKQAFYEKCSNSRIIEWSNEGLIGKCSNCRIIEWSNVGLIEKWSNCRIIE